MEELLNNKIFAMHALAGVGSVALGTAVTYPLDTVKVIIQVLFFLQLDFVCFLSNFFCEECF